MTSINGYVTKIIHQDTSGFTVLFLRTNGRKIKCVGNLINISTGNYVKAIGYFDYHPQYGEQFNINGYEIIRTKKKIKKKICFLSIIYVVFNTTIYTFVI